MERSPGPPSGRVLAGAAAAALLLTGVVLMSLGVSREERRADAWVSHTRDVLETALRAADLYQDVPLHSERYVVTREPRELGLVEESQKQLASEIQTMRALTRDNPAQQARVDALDRVIRDGEAYNVRIRKQRSVEGLRAVLAERPVKPLDNVRAAGQEIVAEEQRLLVERRRRLDASFRRVRAAFLIACVIAFGAVVASLLLLTEDIRRRRRYEAELVARTQELQRSNDELERFAYVASHDLKEPLRMIVSYTQLLERRYKGKLDAQADEFIRYAVDGALRMASLIDGLLEFSRAGRPVELGRVELGGALDAAERNLRAALEESGGRVERGTLPVVRGNQLELARVLQNLVGNALKFRGPQRPVVRVDARRSGAEWIVRVADNGIGLSPEDREKVFLLFHRLHARSRYPGTGIGLAICKKIVESRGGRIWAEGETGRGTTFCFTVPADDTPS